MQLKKIQRKGYIGWEMMGGGYEDFVPSLVPSQHPDAFSTQEALQISLRRCSVELNLQTPLPCWRSVDGAGNSSPLTTQPFWDQLHPENSHNEDISLT